MSSDKAKNGQEAASQPKQPSKTAQVAGYLAVLVGVVLVFALAYFFLIYNRQRTAEVRRYYSEMESFDADFQAAVADRLALIRTATRTDGSSDEELAKARNTPGLEIEVSLVTFVRPGNQDSFVPCRLAWDQERSLDLDFRIDRFRTSAWHGVARFQGHSSFEEELERLAARTSFDAIVLADHEGRIRFRGGPSKGSISMVPRIEGSEWASVISPQAAESASSGGENQTLFSRFGPLVAQDEVSGRVFTLFPREIQLDLAKLAAAAGTTEGEVCVGSLGKPLRAVGLVESRKLVQTSRSFPPGQTLLVLTLLVSVLLVRAAVSAASEVSTWMAAVALAVLVSLSGMSSLWRLNASSWDREQLKRLATEIQAHFTDEVGKAHEQLETIAAYLGRRGVGAPNPRCEAPSGPPWNCAIYKPDSEPCGLTDQLLSLCSIPRLAKKEWPHPFFERYLIVDRCGKPLFFGTARARPLRPATQTGRPHFERALLGESLVVEPVASRTGGERLTAVARTWNSNTGDWGGPATEDSPCSSLSDPAASAIPQPLVVTAAIRLLALEEAVLPEGFQFAVVDRTGAALYHSDPNVAGQPGFVDSLEGGECLKVRLAAIEPGYCSARAQGRRQLVYAQNLETDNTVQWKLLVFRSEEPAEATQLGALSVAGWQLGLLWLGVGCGLVCAGLKGRALIPRRLPKWAVSSLAAVTVMLGVAVLLGIPWAQPAAGLFAGSLATGRCIAIAAAKPARRAWIVAALSAAACLLTIALPLWFRQFSPLPWHLVLTALVVSTASYLITRQAPRLAPLPARWRRALAACSLVLFGVLPVLGFYREAISMEESLAIESMLDSVGTRLIAREERLASPQPSNYPRRGWKEERDDRSLLTWGASQSRAKLDSSPRWDLYPSLYAVQELWSGTHPSEATVPGVSVPKPNTIRRDAAFHRRLRMITGVSGRSTHIVLANRSETGRGAERTDSGWVVRRDIPAGKGSASHWGVVLASQKSWSPSIADFGLARWIIVISVPLLVLACLGAGLTAKQRLRRARRSGRRGPSTAGGAGDKPAQGWPWPLKPPALVLLLGLTLVLFSEAQLGATVAVLGGLGTLLENADKIGNFLDGGKGGKS